MPDQRPYATRRESGRTQSIIIYAIFVTSFGLLTAFSVHGVVRLLIVLGVVAVLGGCIAFLVIAPPAQNQLTPISWRARAESWSASTPQMTFPAFANASPARRDAELFGTVTLGPDGVTFEPSARAMRAPGVETLRWDTSWSMQARRLRGPGGQVQLSVISPNGNDSVTFWLHRAQGFMFR